MNKFYYKTDFDFSNTAKSWILNRYEERFDDAFFHDLDITQYNSNSQSEWRESLPGQELKEFLSKFNCDINYYGIGVFISNTEQVVRGNPHIDAKFSQGTIHRIKSRFNVMILSQPCTAAPGKVSV